MKIEHSFSVDFPPDKVAEVLCSEEYNLETERRREGVVSTSFEMVEDGPGGKVFRLLTEEYSRTRTGGLDRSKTVKTIIEHRYDPSDWTLRWLYKKGSGSPSKLHLAGTYTLRAAAGGTKVTHEVEIEVKIPLVGGSIARLIAGEFKKELPVREGILRSHLERGAG